MGEGSARRRCLNLVHVAVGAATTSVVTSGATGVGTLPLGGVRRGVVVRVFHLSAIVAGDALHLLAVLVVAGNLHGGLG